MSVKEMLPVFLLGISVHLQAQIQGVPTGWCTDRLGNNVRCSSPPAPHSPPPPSPEERAKQVSNEGDKLAERGDLKGALEKYLEAAELAPNHSEIQEHIRAVRAKITDREATSINNEGFDLENRGDLNKALRRYLDAAQLEPKDTVIANNIKRVRAKIAEKQKNAVLDELSEVVNRSNSRSSLDFAAAHSREEQPKLDFRQIGPAKPKDELDFSDPRNPERTPAHSSWTWTVNMPSRAAELVAAMNVISNLPEYQNPRTGQTNSALPKGRPIDQKLLDMNCQTFFRALGEELSRRGLPSWSDSFPVDRIGQPMADGIVAEIDKMASEPKNWRKIDSWEEAQRLANEGAVVIGGLRADLKPVRDSQGHLKPRRPYGHIAIVLPAPPEIDLANFDSAGHGPFVRDGDEHLYAPTDQLTGQPTGERRFGPSTWGSIRASRAMPLKETLWYLFIPSTQ